jgi:uncharacterized membrane protein YraQ (UPF0718 family)
MINLLKKFRWTLVFVAVVGALFVYESSKGEKALDIALDNVFMVLQILPPILIFIGLLEVWVPREVMVRHMGKDSGLRGLLIAFFLGAVAAGPLFLAFPLAALLARKGARYAYIVFFLGVLATAKLPIIVFEYSFFGGLFTLVHVFSGLAVHLVGAFVVERLAGDKALESLGQKADS